jgi:NitT/TauT family transport system ATP-binding protein
MQEDHAVARSIKEVGVQVAAHIDISGLGKVFETPAGPIEVLQNVELSIAKGEFVSVLGASGCGKSTLLKIIAGLDRPTTGHVVFDPPARSKQHCAMVFQSHSLFPWRSALANVTFGLEQSGYPRAEAEKIGRSWLKQVGLEQFVDYFPHQLSGGMQQRVGLARAFAYDADILLMDEPFSSVDALTRRSLQQLLIELSERYDKTILYITHSVDEAILLSDRIAMLSHKTGDISVIHSVDLPRPRSQQLDYEPEMSSGSLKHKLWHEVMSQQTELLDSETNLDASINSAKFKEGAPIWQALWFPLLLLLTWEILSQFKLIDSLFFPAPSYQFMMLIEQLTNGELLQHTLATLTRMSVTFILSIIIGGGIGFAMGMSRPIRNSLYPTIAALYPIPKIVILPFCMLIFGIGYASLIAIGVIAASFLVLMNTYAGVMNVSTDIVMAGRVYGANKIQLISKVILPAALPFIFVGIRLGMGMALAVMVASEFIAADNGLGYVVWTSWQILDMDAMYPAIIVVTFIGVLFHHGMKWLEKKYLPWQMERD